MNALNGFESVESMLAASARGLLALQAAPEPQAPKTSGNRPRSNSTCNAAPMADNSLKEIQPAPLNRTCFGVDNGFTGAIACLGPLGEVLFQPVAVLDLGKEKLLDVDGNLFLIRRMLEKTGCSPNQAWAVFEQGQIAPKFGARNNYTNGKNNEFWRVLFTLAQIPFSWVNPRVCQEEIFRGIRGDNTKVMADLVRRQRFPELNLNPYNLSQREGINDAIGIALWARRNSR